MIFCFDMDGTLTKAPNVLGEIMRSLKKNGHTVYILTGSLGETPQEELIRYRTNQAKSLGLDGCFDDIVCCVNPSFEGVAFLKGKFCREEKVDFVIDDAALFIQAIRKESPDTFIAGVV